MNLADQADKAGIVGASGSGYPLSLKLQTRCDLVIANGAECEPLLAADRTLMRRQGREILTGLSLAMDAVGAKKGILALRQGNDDTVAILQQLVAPQAHLELRILPEIYPIGDAHLLVHELTGAVVPEGGYPESIGILVSNVHTLWHLARSKDAPVTWRYVTIGGAIENPQVLRVPTGMLIADVLNLCGGATVANPVFLLGGPMQGEITRDASRSLDKKHGGLFVFASDHPIVDRRLRPVEVDLKRAALNCGGCRRCIDMCPRALMGHNIKPQGIIRALAQGGEAMDAVTQAPLCSGCGLCEVICPANLSPRRFFSEVKEMLAAKGWANVHRRQTPKPTGDWAGRQVPRAQVTEKMGLKPYDVSPKVLDFDLALQHLKVPFAAGQTPTVRTGDRILWGAVIAKPTGSTPGPWVHAPMPGIIGQVDQEMIEIFSS